MVRVSVIMPVYNAAEFLAEAIDGVLGQTLKEIELIAVNDGSADESQDILEQYAKQDFRLIVLNQENQGPSAARNLAMQHASGEYVFFQDADDFMEKDALEKLYARALEQNAELVIAKYDIYNGITYVPVFNLNSMVVKDQIDRFDKTILWTFSLWNKLFKRSLIEENHIVFPPVSYSEDGVFTMNCVYKASRITGLDKVVLHYRRVTNAVVASITATVSEGKIRDYLEAHRMILELIEAEHAADGYRYSFLYKEINILFTQFYRKFWNIEPECRTFLAGQIRELLGKLDVSTFLRLQTMHQEICFDRIADQAEEVLRNARLTVALYGNEDNSRAFLDTLLDLESQSFVPMKICVPENMRTVIVQAAMERENLIYAAGDDREQFLEIFRKQINTRYYLIAETEHQYEVEALRQMYLKASGEKYAVITDYEHIHGSKDSKEAFVLYETGRKGRRGLIEIPKRKSRLRSLWKKYRPYNVRMKFPIAKVFPLLKKLPMIKKNWYFRYEEPYDIINKIKICGMCCISRQIITDHDSVFLHIFPLRNKQEIIINKP